MVRAVTETAIKRNKTREREIHLGANKLAFNVVFTGLVLLILFSSHRPTPHIAQSLPGSTNTLHYVRTAVKRVSCILAIRMTMQVTKRNHSGALRSFQRALSAGRCEAPYKLSATVCTVYSVQSFMSQHAPLAGALRLL